VIARPAVIGPIPLAGHQICADQVRIDVDTDTEMAGVAATAKRIEPVTQAGSAAELRSVGETAPPTPCPASGEFPDH